MDQQRVAGPHLAECCRGDERNAGHVLPIRVVVARLAAEAGWHVLLAKEPAQVVQAGSVTHAREEQLG